MESQEEFTPQQTELLLQFVSNTNKSIFVLKNLPEVIKGALFSRYSRSSLGLRSLLLKEFIGNEETAFDAITGNSRQMSLRQLDEQSVAIKKAQNFYDRILDGYGDDSISELGGAHLAIENISMLAAKEVEDCRIGGSPLEKSTRYIYFDQKINGEYLFYREPILMASAYRSLYLDTCNHLFETYSQLAGKLTEIMEKKFPKEEAHTPGAYTAALRAKVLDCLRGLLPASCLTNMGLYGNGRFFEGMIQKLHQNSLTEMQEVATSAYEELSCVIPSFIKRSEKGHKHQMGFDAYLSDLQHTISSCTHEQEPMIEDFTKTGVRLIRFDEDSITKVAAALGYSYSQKGLKEWYEHFKTISEEQIVNLFEQICEKRQNRRHKSPRALEHASFTFEILSDFGIYRDLHRHRTLTQERQLLSCDYGFWIPPEIRATELETPYINAMLLAKEAFDKMRHEFPEEAQYSVPMAYHVRWYFHINLRALQWLCELRSSPAGHPTYRFVAQEMAKQVIAQFPAFAPFFKFVDFDGYDLGRIDQEQRRETRTKGA